MLCPEREHDAEQRQVVGPGVLARHLLCNSRRRPVVGELTETPLHSEADLPLACVTAESKVSQH